MKKILPMVILLSAVVSQAQVVPMSNCTITLRNGTAQQAAALTAKGFTPVATNLAADAEMGSGQLILAVTGITSAASSKNGNSKTTSSIEVTYGQQIALGKGGIQVLEIGKFSGSFSEPSEALDAAISSLPHCKLKM